MLNFLRRESRKDRQKDEREGLRQPVSQEVAQGHEEAQVEPEFPTLDEAREIHDQALLDHGQPQAHLINPDYLDGALGRAANYWYYGDGTPEEKMADAAGALAHGVGAAQAFEDGNKRTAYHVARYFLHNNGYGHLSPVEFDDDELADHLIGHGSGTHSLEDTQQLFRSRMDQQRTASAEMRWDRTSSDLNVVPPVLYHGSPSRNRRSIAQEGLTGGAGNYMFDDPERAAGYGDVWVVDTDGLELAPNEAWRVEDDPEMRGVWVTFDDIPPQNLSLHQQRTAMALASDHLEQWIQERGPYLWHGRVADVDSDYNSTHPTEIKDRILNEGLTGNPGYWHQPTVYLTPNRRNAEAFADNDMVDGGKPGALFRVDLRKLDPRNLEVDEWNHGYESAESPEDVLPGDQEKFEDSGNVLNELQKGYSVAHRGDIPGEALEYVPRPGNPEYTGLGPAGSPHGEYRTSNILDPIHDALDPRVWDDPASPEPTLKPEHSQYIHEKIFSTLEAHGYDGMERWLSLVLTGSLTTYQYADHSDVDISLFVDVKKFPEWSRAEMIGIMIENCDGTLLPGTPFPLQDFVVPPGITKEDLYKPGLRSGYDLATDTWIVPPDRNRVHDVENEMNEAYTVALENADKMDRLLRYEPDKAIQFWHQIHKRRQRDQKAGRGDYSPSNITYKMLANRGLFPRLEQASGEYIAHHEAPHDSLVQRDFYYHEGSIPPERLRLIQPGFPKIEEVSGEYLAKTAMAERTGNPELDAAIAEFMMSHHEELGNIQDFQHPEVAWGQCEVVAEACAEFLQKRGFNASTTTGDLDEYGYNDAQKSENVGAGEFTYPEHCTVAIYNENGLLWWTIDFTAAQYGYKEFPKVEPGPSGPLIGPQQAVSKAAGNDFWDKQWEYEDANPGEYDPRFTMSGDTHDYDPRNDFEIRMDQLDHPHIKDAQSWLDRFAQSPQSWFNKAHVYPAREGMGKAVGMYINGTYNEPVIMVNLDAHDLGDDYYMPEMKNQEMHEGVMKTVEHELRHAWQDWEQKPMMGDEAEDDAERHRWDVLSKTAHYADQLQQIAQAYNEAPEYEPQAHAAWEELAADSKRRADQLRQQYNIQVTDNPEPYANAQEMFNDLAKGNFTVSRANSEHPIWTPEQNVDFRTVHDILGHNVSKGDFSWEGENQACAAHAPLLSPEAQRALFTECIAQTAAANVNGGFGPQKTAFVDTPAGVQVPYNAEQQLVTAAEGDGTFCHRHIRRHGRRQ